MPTSNCYPSLLFGPLLDECLISKVFGCSLLCPCQGASTTPLTPGSRMELTLEGSAKRMGSGTEVLLLSSTVRVTCSNQYGLKVRNSNLSSMAHSSESVRHHDHALPYDKSLGWISRSRELTEGKRMTGPNAEGKAVWMTLEGRANHNHQAPLQRRDGINTEEDIGTWIELLRVNAHIGHHPSFLSGRGIRCGALEITTIDRRSKGISTRRRSICTAS